MRKPASYMTLALGAALIAAGCCIPMIVVPAEWSSPVVDIGHTLTFRHYLVLPIAGCAFPLDPGALQGHDSHVVSGEDASVWPARFILVSAFASFCLIAAGRRRAALAATGALASSVVWLFVVAGALHAETSPDAAAGWTAYPPLSTAPASQVAPPFGTTWWVWAALATGTLLLAASALLRDERGESRDLTS